MENDKEDKLKAIDQVEEDVKKYKTNEGEEAWKEKEKRQSEQQE